MENRFSIDDERRRLFAGTFLIDYMARESKTFDVLLSPLEQHLDPIFQWLMSRELVEISKKNHYELTAKGKEATTAFANHYRSLLTYFDAFSHVDLEAGDFALTSFSEFESEAEWKRFVQGDRWEDLRVPVAEHLEADPVELVFFYYVRENRSDTDSTGWELGLADGQIWDEVLEICNGSVAIADLGFESEDGVVTGEQVLDDVIEQGFKVVRELSGEDREVLAHLARWAPIREPELAPDDSALPIWRKPWALPVSA